MTGPERDHEEHKRLCVYAQLSKQRGLVQHNKEVADQAMKDREAAIVERDKLRAEVEAYEKRIPELCAAYLDKEKALVLQIGALKKFNVAEVMRHDSRVAALVLQIREVRPFLEALAEGNLIDARVKAQTILNDMEKPKGETFPLCECGHNHRTEPGHYTTMNCNMKGCPCTYFTEKPKSELPYCTVKRLDSLEGSICGIRLPCPHHAEKRKCEHRWTPINLDPDFDSQCMKCGAKENQA
jgi:hypothetical protein